MPHHLAFTKYAAELDQAIDLDSLPKFRFLKNHDFIERLQNAVSFDFIAISGLDIDGYRLGSGGSIDTTFPPAFVESYIADGIYFDDPLIKRAKESGAVLQDSDVIDILPPRLQYLLRTFRIYNRVLIPVGPPSNVFGAVVFTREKPFGPDEVYFFSVVAEATHQTITGPIMEKFGAAALKLTKGEILCLQEASLGLTSERISEKTGFQTETVNAYVKAATKKLGAANRTRAIIEALQLGLLRPM